MPAATTRGIQYVSSTDGEQPPGWYPDPRDPSRHRYWDGERWSELAAADAPGSTEPDAGEGAPSGTTARPPRTVVIALVLAAVALLAVAAWILTRDGDGGDEERTGSPTTAITPDASGEDPPSGSDTTTSPSDPPPSDPSDPSPTDAPPTSAGGATTPGSADLAPCEVDDTLLLELLREHPPLASVADGLTVERVRCVGDWASAVASATLTDSALALYRREGGDWTFILLGSSEPCTALGIPVAAEAELGCNEWTSG